MKAILVVNKMPKNSEECPFFEKWKGYDRYDYCSIHNPTTVIGNSDKRCDGCPLKPMPLKMNVRDELSDRYNLPDNEYCRGWNECLDEIGEIE